MKILFYVTFFVVSCCAPSFASQDSLSSQSLAGWEVRPAAEKGYSRAYVSSDHNCVVSIRSNKTGVRIFALARSDDDTFWQITTITRKSFLRSLVSLFRNRIRLSMEFEEWRKGQLVKDTKRDDGSTDIFALKYSMLAREIPASDRKLFWNTYDSRLK